MFKGGTALKKGYFGGYRFSEDLDSPSRSRNEGGAPPYDVSLVTAKPEKLAACALLCWSGLSSGLS